MQTLFLKVMDAISSAKTHPTTFEQHVYQHGWSYWNLHSIFFIIVDIFHTNCLKHIQTPHLEYSRCFLSDFW